jgi:exo-beta-1,3-glucanase (GH17 family)
MKLSWPLNFLAAASLSFSGVPLSVMADQILTNEQNYAAFTKQESGSLISGFYRAVAYSGFRTGQHPDRGKGAKNPTYEQIVEDLNLLVSVGKFPLIRLYDSQENSRTVLQAISEENLPVKVLLGAWLDAELSNHLGCAWLTEPIPEEELESNRMANEAEVKRAIELAKEYPQIVIAINVGNEALIDWNDHLVSIESMIAYIKQVKAAVPQPVTTADNYVAWINHGEALSAVVDFAGVHTYPIWEHKPIEEGLPYTIENLVAVQRALPDVPLAIMEAGWATTASEFPDQANQQNQATYFKRLMDWSQQMNVTTFWFEAFDEDWKGNPNDSSGAEKHWGLFTVKREAKAVMR